MAALLHATIGLYLAHRVYDAKGRDHIRAFADADRVFLREDGGLLVPKGQGIEVVEKGSHEVTLEKLGYSQSERDRILDSGPGLSEIDRVVNEMRASEMQGAVTPSVASGDSPAA